MISFIRSDWLHIPELSAVIARVDHITHQSYHVDDFNVKQRKIKVYTYYLSNYFNMAIMIIKIFAYFYKNQGEYDTDIHISQYCDM